MRFCIFRALEHSTKIWRPPRYTIRGKSQLTNFRFFHETKWNQHFGSFISKIHRLDIPQSSLSIVGRGFPCFHLDSNVGFSLLIKVLKNKEIHVSSPNSKDFPQFIDGFLDRNRHLFTILGIFGAISVYLVRVTTELPQSSGKVLNTAMFSSLLLFCLVGYFITKKYMRRYMEFSGVPILLPRWRNLTPAVPLVLFNALLVTVLFFAFQAILDTWRNSLSSVIFLFSFYLSVVTPPYISAKIEKYTERPSESVLFWVSFFLYVIFIPILAYLSLANTPALSGPIYDALYYFASAILMGPIIIMMNIGVTGVKEEFSWKSG